MEQYNVGFPDEFAHPNVKEKSEWGLQAAKAIWDYGVHHCGWNLNSRRERFHLNELYAQGLQGQDKYKPAFSDGKGAPEHMQLFWKETSPLPKYIRSTIKSLIENKYEPKVTALDGASQSEKDREYTKMKRNLLLRHAEETQLKGTGIKLVPKGEYVPGSLEEIELRKNLGFKTSLEIAQELALKTVLYNNNVDVQQRKTASSLTITQWGGVRCYYDEYNDIKFKAIDVENLIVPYSTDERFSDRKFTAVVESMTISEIRARNSKMAEPVYSDEEIFDLARSVSGKHLNGTWNNDFTANNYSQYWNSFSVSVLIYEIKTLNKKASLLRKDKANGRTTFSPTKPHSEPKIKDNKEVISKERTVWYDGIWVLGSKKLLEHKLRENQVFEGGINGFYDGEPMSQFVIIAPEIYQMRNKAIPESAQVYVDNMHKAVLKYQQFLNEIAPPMFSADTSAMMGALDGLGIQSGTPMDIMKIAKQTRVLYYNSKNLEGEFINQNPFKEVNTQINREIAAIADMYNMNLQALESELGINDAMVGQTRNRYEGLGATELKLNAGAKALSHLQDGQNYIWDEVIKILSVMVQDTISRGDKIRGFENAIGKTNVSIIKLQKDLTVAELGCKLEMLPSQQDYLRFIEKINLALQRDTIAPSAATMAEEMAKVSVKNAYMFMALKEREYEEQKMKAAAAQAQSAAQANSGQQQESAAMAFELDKKKKLLEHSLKIQEDEWIKALEEKNQQAEHLDKMELERIKGEEKIRQIQEANANNLQNTESGSTAVKQPRVYSSVGTN